jgi:hypothetical protein
VCRKITLCRSLLGSSRRRDFEAATDSPTLPKLQDLILRTVLGDIMRDALKLMIGRVRFTLRPMIKTLQ